MPILGAGASPAGSSPAGSGTPAQAPAPSGAIFQDPVTGKQLDGRLINPQTRRYQFGTTGRVQGQLSVPQLVQIALTNVLGSAADPTVGQTFSQIQDIGPNFAQQVTARVQLALADLINRKLVALLSVDVTAGNAGLNRVRWRDLTVPGNSPGSGTENTTPLFAS
jgi:hypothetical protein